MRRKSPDYQPPEYPYDMELMLTCIASKFDVTIERARQIIEQAYTDRYGEKHKKALAGGNFKVEITEDERYGKIAIITRQSTGYQIVIGATVVKHGTGEGENVVEIPNIFLVAKREYTPQLSAQPPEPKQDGTVDNEEIE